MCARVQSDVLRVLRVLVFQFSTCLLRHVFGVLGVLCVLLGLCVLCALCALYAFSKLYVQHRGPQKRASGQKHTDGRQRNILLATTRRTHSTNFCCIFAFIIVLCFRGFFEGARRDGNIRLAQFNHFQGENPNCLLPLPLSWCYACYVCCAFYAFPFGASESASRSDLRSTHSAGPNFFTPIIQHCFLFFVVFLPCLHRCSLPHPCTGFKWMTDVRIRMTIASCLCLCLGATLPTCVRCFECCHFLLLTLPLETLYVFYVLCSMFLPHHC